MLENMNVESMAGMTLNDRCESLANSNPDKEFRVEVCDHTGKRVVQVQESDGSWFCLHEESEF